MLEATLVPAVTANMIFIPLVVSALFSVLRHRASAKAVRSHCLLQWGVNDSATWQEELQNNQCKCTWIIQYLCCIITAMAVICAVQAGVVPASRM